MTDCKLCKHAQWHKTSNGRLHPSGDGECTYEVKIPVIPAAKWWSCHTKPSTTFGAISRRLPLKVVCPCFEATAP